MKAIIAEDEIELGSNLKRTINRLWPDLDIISQVETGPDALEKIECFKPDIAFLDIQMPGMNGLEVASQIRGDTKVVFISAYDSYAIDAFEKNAIDYLLKPVKEERLIQTINRLLENGKSTNNKSYIDSIRSIRDSVSLNQSSSLKWIKALKGNTVYMVNTSDIIYFKSDNKNTSVHTIDQEYDIRISLNKLETMLDKSNFWRIHRSIIINVEKIKSAEKKSNGRHVIKLKDTDVTLDVSRAYAHLFKHL